MKKKKKLKKKERRKREGERRKGETRKSFALRCNCPRVEYDLRVSVPRYIKAVVAI